MFATDIAMGASYTMSAQYDRVINRQNIRRKITLQRYLNKDSPLASTKQLCYNVATLENQLDADVQFWTANYLIQLSCTFLAGAPGSGHFGSGTWPPAVTPAGICQYGTNS